MFYSICSSKVMHIHIHPYTSMWTQQTFFIKDGIVFSFTSNKCFSFICSKKIKYINYKMDFFSKGIGSFFGSVNLSRHLQVAVLWNIKLGHTMHLSLKTLGSAFAETHQLQATIINSLRKLESLATQELHLSYVLGFRKLSCTKFTIRQLTMCPLY